MSFINSYRFKPPAPLPFIFSVTVTTGQSFQLPTVSGGTYDCIIDWGDTTSNALTVWNAAGRSKTYAVGGTYDITITGVFTGWSVSNYADKLKIRVIKQWGILKFSVGAARQFWGCSNLTVTATDVPDLSGSSSYSLFFASCSSLVNIPNLQLWEPTGNSIWDQFFIFCTNFIGVGIEDWPTDHVTNMSRMLLGCPNFNRPIGAWDTPLVTNMWRMLQSSTSFNQDLSGLNITSLEAGLNTGADRLCDNTALSTANYNAMLISYSSQAANPLVRLGVNPTKYSAAPSAAATARELLTRANVTVAISSAANNGSGLIRIVSAAHGRATGEKIFISGVVGTTEANGGWIVTVINATTCDLQASTFTNAYTSSGTLRTGFGWIITDGGPI